MRKNTSAEPTLTVLMRSCCSLAWNASWNSGLDVLIASGMIWLSHLQKHIDPRVIGVNPRRLSGSAVGFQRRQIICPAVIQMPIEQMCHAVAGWVGGFDIGDDEQTAGRHLI